MHRNNFSCLIMPGFSPDKILKAVVRGLRKPFFFLFLFLSVASIADAQLYFNPGDNRPGLVWQKCLGGSLEDVASSVVLTRDGGQAIAGYSYSNDGDITGHH